jgi:hypothetical protein
MFPRGPAVPIMIEKQTSGNTFGSQSIMVGPNQRQADRLLEIARQTLRLKLHELGLYVTGSVGAVDDDQAQNHLSDLRQTALPCAAWPPLYWVDFQPAG